MTTLHRHSLLAQTTPTRFTSGLPLLAAALLLGAAICESAIAQSAPATEASGIFDERPQRRVTALLRIRFPDSAWALNHHAVSVVLNGAGVGQRAAREVLGLSAEEASDAYWLSFLPPAGGEFSLTSNADGVTLLGIIDLQVGESICPSQEKAEALLRRMSELLGDALPTDELPDRPALERELSVLRDEMNATQNQQRSVNKVGAELRAQAGEIDITDWDQILGTLTRLQEQRTTLEQEQVAQEARRRALLEQLLKVKQEVDAAVTDNPTLRELEHILALREEQQTRVSQLAEAGQASDGDLLATREQVAQARAELARQRQESAASVAGGLLARLNEELVMLAVSHEETAARLAHTRDQCERYMAAREQARRFDDQVNSELSKLSRQIAELEQRDNDLGRRLRSARPRPRVELLGQGATSRAVAP